MLNDQIIKANYGNCRYIQYHYGASIRVWFVLFQTTLIKLGI